jgi:hypothetical protein
MRYRGALSPPVNAVADPIDRHAFGGERSAKAFPDHGVIFQK